MTIRENKSPQEIYREWDQLAPLRLSQVSSGADITYAHVLTPNIIDLCQPLQNCRILDAGCGVGMLSFQLAQISKHVLGLDPSSASISLAGAQFHAANLDYSIGTIEDYAPTEAYEVVVANMTLACCLDLDAFLSATSRALTRSGRFVFSLPHPCFWPNYWGYADDPAFRYDRETIIEKPFRITSDKNNALVSTHIHRPLSRYLESISNAGMVLQQIREPFPPAEVEALYDDRWTAARYLFGLCVKPQVVSYSDA